MGYTYIHVGKAFILIEVNRSGRIFLMEQTPTPLSKRGQAAQSPQTSFQSLRENSTENNRKYTWEEEEEKNSLSQFSSTPKFSRQNFPLSIASSQPWPLKKHFTISSFLMALLPLKKIQSFQKTSAFLF